MRENLITKSMEHNRKLMVPKMSVKIVQPFDEAPPGAEYIVAESSWPQLPPYKRKHEHSGKLIAWKYGLDKINECKKRYTYLCFTDGSKRDDLSIGAGYTIYTNENQKLTE